MPQQHLFYAVLVHVKALAGCGKRDDSGAPLHPPQGGLALAGYLLVMGLLAVQQVGRPQQHHGTERPPDAGQFIPVKPGQFLINDLGQSRVILPFHLALSPVS